MKKVTSERDELINMLKKSQSVLLQCQDKLQASERSLELEKDEVKRLKNELRNQDMNVKQNVEQDSARLRDLIRTKDKELDTCKQNLAVKEQEAKTLQQAIQQMQAALRERDQGVDSERSNLQKSMDAQRIMTEELQKKLQVAQQQVNSKEASIAELKKQLQTIQTENKRKTDELTSKVATLEKQLQVSATSNDNALKEDVRKLLDELDHTQNELKNLALEKDKVSHQNQQIRNELDKKQVGHLVYTNHLFLFLYQSFYYFVINVFFFF